MKLAQSPAPDGETTASYQESLSRGRMPNWYGYLGPGGQEHLQWSKNSEYRQTCWSLLDEGSVLAAIAQTNKAIAFVDVGCGSGDHAADLLGDQRVRGTIRSYLALDVSPLLVGEAKHRIENVLSIPANGATWNFELTPTEHIQQWRSNPGGQGCVVLGLLGLTLGNTDDPRVVFQNLAQSTEVGDHLICTVRSGPPTTKDLESYNSPDFLRASFGPFAQMGFDQAMVDMEVTVEENAFVGYLQPRQSFEIQGVQLKPTDRIQFFYSARFEEGRFADLASGTPWRYLNTRSSNGIVTLLFERAQEP